MADPLDSKSIMFCGPAASCISVTTGCRRMTATAIGIRRLRRNMAHTAYLNCLRERCFGTTIDHGYNRFYTGLIPCTSTTSW